MSGFVVDRLEQLDEPPRDPGVDQMWWEADVRDDDENPYTIQLWVTGSAAMQVLGEPDAWVRAELERLVSLYDDVGTLYAMQPIQLLPT